jgi:hypothetical protein
MIGLDWFHHEFSKPQTPEWAERVERWYQLDAAAFALADTFWRHRESLGTRPEILLLASPSASNLTDHAFAVSEIVSPAKFVHTLPNIRGASLLQLMNWNGEVYCLQNDPQTVLTALSESIQMLRGGAREVWIASVTVREPEFTGHIFRLRPDAPKCHLKIAENEPLNMAIAAAHDKDLFEELLRRG